MPLLLRCLATLALLAPTVALLLGWYMVALVDFQGQPLESFNVVRAEGGYPLLWYHLFSEARPVEWLQWSCQGVGFCVALTGYVHARRHTRWLERRVFFLLSAGLLLMLAEDSLNVRHMMADAYWIPWFESYVSSRQIRMVWESFFYLCLSALMVSALWIMLTSGAPWLLPSRRLILAYSIYGMVGFGSALRRINDWQERLGHWLIERTRAMELPAWEEAYRRYEAALEANPDYEFTLGYLLTDHLLEESVELIAATLLLSGILIVASRYARQVRSHRVEVEASNPVS